MADIPFPLGSWTISSLSYQLLRATDHNRWTAVKVKIMLWPMVIQPVCLGVQHPSGAQDQIFVTVRQLRVCWRGAPSLMKGWVCRLQLLLTLTSAVILGSESRRMHDHTLLSQTPPTWRERWPYLYPLRTGWPSCTFRHWIPSSPPMTRRATVEIFATVLVLLITSWQELCRKRHFPYLLHCCVHVCWGDHMIITEPLLSNGRYLQSHSLATAVSAGFTVLPWANMPQYFIYLQVQKLWYDTCLEDVICFRN
jgi:hypothetical protein